MIDSKVDTTLPISHVHANSAWGKTEEVTHVTVRPSLGIQAPKMTAKDSPILHNAQIVIEYSKKILAEVCMPTATFI
jgi:hypothetical protein